MSMCCVQSLLFVLICFIAVASKQEMSEEKLEAECSANHQYVCEIR